MITKKHLCQMPFYFKKSAKLLIILCKLQSALKYQLLTSVKRSLGQLQNWAGKSMLDGFKSSSPPLGITQLTWVFWRFIPQKNLSLFFKKITQFLAILRVIESSILPAVAIFCLIRHRKPTASSLLTHVSPS